MYVCIYIYIFGTYAHGIMETTQMLYMYITVSYNTCMLISMRYSRAIIIVFCF